MKASFQENKSVQAPSLHLARLRKPCGYRFDGDTVHLNAKFALLDRAAHECSWAMQLWACASAPVSAQDIYGHLIAEVALPPMVELADDIEHFDVSAFARLPAGPGEHVMVLALVSGRPGQFNEIHDFAVFSDRQDFIQPRLSGSVGYRIDGRRVQLSVDRVENPRAESNRSGTLSLELWALSAPYAGGTFQGHHLAGVEIGAASGQGDLALQPIDLAFTQPPAGTWQIVLMLREWTAAGFITRDFTNFAVPFVSAPVIEAPVVANVPPKPAALAPAKVAPSPTVASIPAAVAAKSTRPAVMAVAAKSPTPEVAKAVAPAAPAKNSAPGVSVNTAKVEELVAIKGISTTLAKGIVSKRPFSSLEDLSRVKGLGPKILGNIRSKLKL
jgi:DNA uptake protein ComE-like DNA-binding protein